MARLSMHGAVRFRRDLARHGNPDASRAQRFMKSRCALALLAAMALAHVQAGETAMEIESSAFVHEGGIPARYTCEGDDVSPPLAWRGVPAGTKSLALIVDDPDAPDPAAPRMTWVHWVLYNMPATASGLPEAVANTDLPPGTRAGTSDFRRTEWGGPCPPIGRHRYFHKLYALDTGLQLPPGARKPDVEQAMRGHVLAEAVLVGTYQKGD